MATACVRGAELFRRLILKIVATAAGVNLAAHSAMAQLAMGRSEKSPQKLQVKLDTEEGYADFTFPVRQVEESSDGTLSVHAQGSLDGSDIGFVVDIFPEWKQQKDDSLVLYWGTVGYRSIGTPSDTFLQILAAKYGLPPGHRLMTSAIELTAVGLQTDPRDIKSSPVTIKLFFEPGPDEAYAEFFTNIDLQEAILEFREKDPGYRVPLVSAFDGTWISHSPKT